MSVALVLIGLGLDLYENNKFSDCVNATGTNAHCATANRGGLIVFGVGLIGLIGAGTVWLVLRKSMVKAN